MFKREATSETQGHEHQFTFDYHDGKYIQQNGKWGTKRELKRQAAGDPAPVENLDIPELAMIYGYVKKGILTHDRDKLFRIEKDFGTLKQIDDNTASRWLNPSLYYTEETNEQCENKRVPDLAGQVRTQVTDEMKDMEVISSFSDFDICSIGQFLNLDDRDNGMIFRTFVDAEK